MKKGNHKDKRRRIDWRNEQHKLKYSAFLTEELIAQGLDKIYRIRNEEVAKSNIKTLSLWIKAACEKTVKHFYGSKKDRKRKFKKSRIWWCDTLTDIRKSRAGNTQKKVKLKQRLALAVKHRKTSKAVKVLKKLKKCNKENFLLNKAYKKLINKGKVLESKIQRRKLIEGFLADPTIFWKEVTSRRGAKIEVDISLDMLKSAYEENFTKITQSDASKNFSFWLEIEMRSIINKYSVWLKNKKCKIKIRTVDICSIMKKLENNKKGGLNGESNEMYKYGVNTSLPKIIANLFQSMIKGGYCPENLNTGLICTIIKDSSQSNQDIGNTRPITLSETLAIIFEHLILKFIHKRTLHKHQFGFRQKSSCQHAVFSLREIMEDVVNKGSNAYAVFLDFSKAFDKVNRIKLLYKLMHYLDPWVWLAVKNYYDKLVLYVQDNKGNISIPFKSLVGVKQGGPASPDLFNDYINDLLISLELSHGTYKLGGMDKGVMVYADDTTIVCDSLDSLNKNIKIIESYCDRYDICINAKKTKCMIFGPIKSIVEPEVKVNGQTLEIVDTFKFLGVHIDRDGGYKKHLNIRRSAFFSGVLGTWREWVWRPNKNEKFAIHFPSEIQINVWHGVYENESSVDTQGGGHVGIESPQKDMRP
jgi:hypothetical protein